MDSFIKLPANQASFDIGANAAKRNVDIDLPAGAVYDLTKSYVNVKLETTLTNAEAPASGVGVVNVFNTLSNGTGNEASLHYPNTAALVKNAQLISNSKGGLESIRDVQTLRSAQAAYDFNLAEQNDDKGKLAHFELNNMYHIHPQNEINKVGSEKSVNGDHDVKIPLSRIFNMCKVAEAYDTSNSAYGSTKIHLELNSQRLGNAEDSTADFATKTLLNVTGAEKIQDMADLDNAANAGATVIDKLISKAAYSSLDSIPFFVSQHVKIGATSTNASGAPVAHDCLITNIKRAKVDDRGGLPDAVLAADVLEITIDPALPAIEGTKKYSAIAMVPTASNNLDNQVIKSVELVAYVNKSDKPPANYTYTTYMSEADSYPVGNTASRLYTIPAGCKNVIICPGNPSAGARSDDANLERYRLAIDNRELTPRAVRINSAMHYDLINQVYKNNGESVHSYLQKAFNVVAGTARTDPGANPAVGCFQQNIIACPVPFKAVPQQLQLDLEAASGQDLNGNLIVYFEVVKQK